MRMRMRVRVRVNVSYLDAVGSDARRGGARRGTHVHPQGLVRVGLRVRGKLLGLGLELRLAIRVRVSY